MKATFPHLAAAAATALLLATSAQASTPYDAVTDFSTTGNSDTSVWSYRTSTSLAHDGQYTLLPNFGPFAGFTGTAALTAGWSNAGVPAIGVNRSGSDQYFIGFGPGAQFTWPAGTMFLHPGGSTLAVLSWLSPSAASLSIDFRFYDMDANANFGDGVAWSVEKNSGAGALASGSFSNGGNSGALSRSNILVAAGDRIQFIVSPNGDFQGDSTRLDAYITASPVPEPSTLALGLAGAALLIARGWRRRAANPT